MKDIHPTHPDTRVDPSSREWIPKTFDGFLAELNHLASSCQRHGSLAFFRGHSQRQWLLDSTFVRSCKKYIFGLPAYARLSERITASIELHRVLLNLFLLKYGLLVRPSSKLEVLAEREGVDSWFELMKKYQQDSREDTSHLKGSNLLDWTQSFDVALYFANDKRSGEGALYICDTTATGKTLQTALVGEILDKMNEVGNSGQALGIPLLFFPPKQIHSQRAKNQQAVYFAQMDLRFDLETHWRLVEKKTERETILVKLVLPSGTEEEARRYLVNKGTIDSFIYPDS